jgi:hypothetical protein
MKTFKNKIMHFWIVGLFLSVITMITASPAMAAIATELRANEEGLYVQYDLGMLGGSKEILLAPGDPMTEIFTIKKLISIEAAVTDIIPEENKIQITAKISSLYFKQEPIEVPIALPFGSFGIYADFRNRQFIPLEGYDIEASFLLSKLQMQYGVNVNLGEIFAGQWEGEATPENNTVHEVIVNPADGSTIAEIDLTLKHAARFFTVLQYNISLTPQESQSSSLEGMHQNSQAISGKILLPNGTYHIWADLDLLTLE